MGLFRRRKPTAAPPYRALPDQATNRDSILEQFTDTPKSAMLPGIVPGILKVLPLDKLFKGIMDLFREPNGKISSKRAGAGALVIAGITYVAEPSTFWAGVVCLIVATALFTLTKFDLDQ